MSLHLATPPKGSVAHICTLDPHLQAAVPICRATFFYARDRTARKKCPQCLAEIRRVLRERPKR